MEFDLKAFLLLGLALVLPVGFIWVVTTFFATPKRFNEHDQRALLEKRRKKKKDGEP
ncbi:hypothetical protein [Deinococcus cellulosilyticus]|uniref:Uncharacterized protein n=1 Tax=Deinococcus cellulosilyticus (strain DSM 18568 / NBRC 106333 / KACC 11606 / 5516J-15) TaxID=1223518 RepID=A0A511N4T4_DEIC1|nr:hypothetical protein [Deinococcus cellulosilyticus]GEM47421.1 hypothetical protein DC3_30560 [Deinococcus cellulosilyticus NBRC 106333 = KACC 11606]